MSSRMMPWYAHNIHARLDTHTRHARGCSGARTHIDAIMYWCARAHTDTHTHTHTHETQAISKNDQKLISIRNYSSIEDTTSLECYVAYCRQGIFCVLNSRCFAPSSQQVHAFFTPHPHTPTETVPKKPPETTVGFTHDETLL